MGEEWWDGRGEYEGWEVRGGGGASEVGLCGKAKRVRLLFFSVLYGSRPFAQVHILLLLMHKYLPSAASLPFFSLQLPISGF